MWTGLELGMSVYHGFTEIFESMASGMGRALQHFGAGDIPGMARQLASAPFEPITSPWKGRRGLQLYRDTATDITPLEQRMVGAMKTANIAPGELTKTGEYDFTKRHVTDWVTAWNRGAIRNELKGQMEAIRESTGLSKAAKIASFPLDQAARTLQTISAPIFQHYIPALKMGTLMRDLESFIKLNPTATDKALAEAARKYADSIDNRMGEANRDNLFTNSFAKDVAFMVMRSPAWTFLGPGREIVGGARSGFYGLAKGVVGKGENRLSPTSKHFDPRFAYSLGYPLTIMTVGALYQFLRSGQTPDEWRDFPTPKTGGTVRSFGREVPERVLMPGYHKDFLGYMFKPGDEIYSKLAVPWQTLWEQAINKREWNDSAIDDLL
jgi:hypothetical protein